jgi:protein ImuB
MKRILCIRLPNRKHPHDPFADRELLERLAAWCERFSPVVGIEQSCGTDCLLLDVSGLDHLFGGEAAMARKIVKSFGSRGLTVRVAIADTIGAAWAVTHSFHTRDHSERSAAAYRIVPHGETTAALEPLPIEALRLAEKTVDLLHQLGIYSIGQLESLPRHELSSRFGRQLLLRMNQAAGRTNEPLEAYRCLPKFCARWSLEHPISRRETVVAAFEKLVGHVATKLAAAGCGALRLECRADCLPAEPLMFTVGMFEPSAAPEHLIELITMQLQDLRFSEPVTCLTIDASHTAPLDYRQREMFFHPANRKQSRRQLAGLVDRLSNRLGRHSVLRGQLCREAQPELAFRYAPLVGATSSTSRKRRTRTSAELPPRPLCLLPQPVALSVLSAASGGGSFQFRLDGWRHEVAKGWGPERIETGWWRGRPIWRDYYRVETTGGRRFWLFRTAIDRRWFLHGTFE